jgi:retinol dehydrogenase 12
VEALRRRGVRGPLESACGDLGELSQVRALAADLTARFPVIDILIHNAGVQRWQRSETVDGIETTLAVNVVAPHLLTQLLRPSLRASKRARVVWLSSMVHAFPLAKLDLNDLQCHDYASERTYYRTKLGVVLLSRWWATELAGDGVTSSSVEPGLVATDFARDFRGFVRGMSRLMRVFMKSPALGAATTAWVASAPELEGVTGRHYSDLREKAASADARDDALGRRYVAEVEALVPPAARAPA